jgi:hypothetical protein
MRLIKISWKIMMIVLAILITAGCIAEKPETESTDVEYTHAILFTRTGALMTLGSGEQVASVNVYSGGEQLISKNINDRATEVFIDFNWEPDRLYRFEVIADGGTAAISNVYAPQKPSLIKVNTIELEDVEGVLQFSPDGRVIGDYRVHILT